MIRFNNDYNTGAHPAVLQALEDSNSDAFGGYGLDEWCEKAKDSIKKYLGHTESDIHFLIGGTQVNYTVISAALRPYQSVVCADSGHIHVHETGAVEHAGHKIEVLKAENGKITASQIRTLAEAYRNSGVKEHITQPKMVYLSFPTEYGTIYTLEELSNIRSVCDEYGMYLFVDGARMGYALGASCCDVTLTDLAALTDCFYIGGTKCGALFGEALVITNPALKEDFRSCMKQNGAMLAKGWLLGLQFDALFRDGLYFSITKKAVALAMKIKEAFQKKGIPFYVESPTNQQFVILSNEQMECLGKHYIFEYEEKIDSSHHCVRFCTSFSTPDSDVSALVSDIEALS